MKVGTTTAELRRALGLPPGPARLVLVSPHPGDEVLGAGRLAYAWARSIGPVTAVLATDGEAVIDHLGERPDGLVARRALEWQHALAVLGVGDHVALRLPDGHLGSHADRLGVLLAGLIDRYRAEGPPALVIAAPDRGDPDPDAAAAGWTAHGVAVETGTPLLTWAADGVAGSDELELPAEAEEIRATALSSFTSLVEPLLTGLPPVWGPELLARYDRQWVVTPDRAPVPPRR